MSKKDYIKIADAIKHAAMDDKARYSVAYVLAQTFKVDNDRFDYDRFMKACGVAE